jgi:hypothetical protein
MIIYVFIPKAGFAFFAVQAFSLCPQLRFITLTKSSKRANQPIENQLFFFSRFSSMIKRTSNAYCKNGGCFRKIRIVKFSMCFSSPDGKCRRVTKKFSFIILSIINQLSKFHSAKNPPVFHIKQFDNQLLLICIRFTFHSY